MNMLIGLTTLALAVLTIFGLISGTILAWWILILFVVGLIAVLITD